MVFKKWRFPLILGAFLFSNSVTAQVSESCDCTVDTTGLKQYLSTLTLNENQPLTFEVENASSTFAVLHGYIDGSTPGVVQNFITNYPNVTTLVFMQMPGSDDDDANLQAAQALRNKGYKHYLPSVNAYPQDAFIASGAVDMFVGGLTRVVDVGGEVGVHSWSDGTSDATDFPEGHVNHMPYINYYVAMGFTQQEAEDFYYFTINSAPAAGIHLMSDNEIDQYKVRSCKYAATPTYSVSQNGNVLSADLQGATYQWIDCNNSNSPIDGATSMNYTATENGSYAVEITENGCSGTSVCTHVVIAGILENETANWSMYPNPVKNEFTIESSSLFQEIEIQILDSKGTLVKSYKGGFNGTITLSMEGLDSGIYHVILNETNSRTDYKLVKY